jgi:fatty acid desaturase
MGRIHRGLLWMHNTLAGRLLLGPPRMILRTLASEARHLAAGDRIRWRDWGAHGLAVGGIGVWAFGIAGMPVWEYILGFVYGGSALMLLRSYLEHQAVETVPERTVVVEAEWPFRLLFLNNNLHAVHHHRPRLPWYRLPERYAAQRDGYLRDNGAYHYNGYLPIIARHFLRAKEPPVHPLQAGPRLDPATPSDPPTSSASIFERAA